jgi:NAD(P)-dependent dehydrogenase (short-subunit alcohol dehydrogenase family)
MSLKDKSAVVTGGSRGLGLGLVEALVAHGARVTVVARGAEALDSVHARLGVATISADVTDGAAAHWIVAELRPDILALNAGVTPPMGGLDQLSWVDFTAPWEHDVKAGLYWLQAALNQPLKPGSRVLVVSSGVAESGSPMSGGYGGQFVAEDIVKFAHPNDAFREYDAQDERNLNNLGTLRLWDFTKCNEGTFSH